MEIASIYRPLSYPFRSLHLNNIYIFKDKRAKLISIIAVDPWQLEGAWLGSEDERVEVETGAGVTLNIVSSKDFKKS